MTAVLLLVALGGGLGAVVRLLAARAAGSARSTLLVNVAGSLVLGLSAGLDELAYAAVGMGFCGGLTTFSTFALEGLEHGWRYVALTIVACVSAAALGLAVAGA